jgi:hypothetical protein
MLLRRCHHWQCFASRPSPMLATRVRFACLEVTVHESDGKRTRGGHVPGPFRWVLRVVTRESSLAGGGRRCHTQTISGLDLSIVPETHRDLACEALNAAFGVGGSHLQDLHREQRLLAAPRSQPERHAQRLAVRVHAYRLGPRRRATNPVPRSRPRRRRAAVRRAAADHRARYPRPDRC